jgi:hypothetical protein
MVINLTWNLTVGLFSGEFFDMDSPSLSVDSLDLTLSALEGSSHDFYDITLADWDRANIVLGLQFLIQMATHDLSSDAWGSWKVSLSWLSSLAWYA